MLKRFDDNPANHTRAVQAWPILIAKAHNRQTLTVTALAQLLHVPEPSTVVYILGHIMLLCRENKLPPLTLLVVNDTTGLPVVGRTSVDYHVEREAVYNYDWYAHWPPSAEDLRAAYLRG
jgi:putative restriction endonuclease